MNRSSFRRDAEGRSRPARPPVRRIASAQGSFRSRSPHVSLPLRTASLRASRISTVDALRFRSMVGRCDLSRSGARPGRPDHPLSLRHRIFLLPASPACFNALCLFGLLQSSTGSSIPASLASRDPGPHSAQQRLSCVWRTHSSAFPAVNVSSANGLLELRVGRPRAKPIVRLFHDC